MTPDPRLLSAERLESALELAEQLDHYKEFAPLLRDHIAALTEAQQWQPIETAPKDGIILVIDRCGFYSIAEWRNGDWIALADGRMAIESQSDFGTDYIKPYPTHWRPLPAPPADAGSPQPEEGGHADSE